MWRLDCRNGFQVDSLKEIIFCLQLNVIWLFPQVLNFFSCSQNCYGQNGDEKLNVRDSLAHAAECLNCKEE